MSKISVAEVERVAKLARIGLSSSEAEKMSAELGEIVGFVEQLSEVNVDRVLPTDQVTGLVDVWREDVIKPSLSRTALLANAPQQENGYIVVKRVLNG
jgi:aspartyl-tRNA(Asn)/glutamyl-tRNA(Gln) amidotransferase subunit C